MGARSVSRRPCPAAIQGAGSATTTIPAKEDARILALSAKVSLLGTVAARSSHIYAGARLLGWVTVPFGCSTVRWLRPGTR
ncbi:hypothetical protein ACLKA6_000152 [Drosophila palustris]